MKRVILWAFGLGLSVLIVLCLLNPFLGMVLLAEITGSGYGHPSHPPALAESMNVASVQSNDKAAQNWNLLVTRHFSKGSRVQDMLATLSNQGFVIVPERHTASYDWGGMPCLYTVSVRWQEDAAHRISAINGGASSGCL